MSENIMATNVPKFYNAWFCPFAQRAWIALLHKGVNFEYLEQNPYNKTTSWLSISPRGLVPAIVHRGHSIYESSVCIEYVDEAWPHEPFLLPRDPCDRAFVRIWADHITKNIVPHYYAMLQKKIPEERLHAKKSLIEQLRVLAKVKKTPGPFFMGLNFGHVDIMLTPFLLRFHVLKHFRDFELPSSSDFDVVREWIAAVESVSSVKATRAAPEKLIANYQRYADDTAQTLVASAVRENSILP